MRRFATNARRTEDKIISDHQCNRATIQWLTIAWANRAGLVPPSLNRTDRHDREIPFWVADIARGLRDGPQQDPWYKRWRSLLAGILEAAGIKNVPITDRASIKAMYKFMETSRGEKNRRKNSVLMRGLC